MTLSHVPATRPLRPVKFDKAMLLWVKRTQLDLIGGSSPIQVTAIPGCSMVARNVVMYYDQDEVIRELWCDLMGARCHAYRKDVRIFIKEEDTREQPTGT